LKQIKLHFNKKKYLLFRILISYKRVISTNEIVLSAI